MTNLIVCCDGTWNTPEQEDNGQLAPTNVFKLHGALADLDSNGAPQLSYYREGVGTSGNAIKRLLGGSLGVGLSNDIKSAYKWMCDNYDPATSRVFLFGFSRGAFAVRSLAGLIGRYGILTQDAMVDQSTRWKAVTTIYDAYRDRLPADRPEIQNLNLHEEVAIDFLGVWDTVGALGIPDELTINIFDRPQKFQFHDTVLGDKVKCARHAVAIDEKRQTFSPTLWTNYDPAVVKQIWFPGVHGDVGGSYAQHGLGDTTLEWMITEAHAEGIAFKANALAQIEHDHQGLLHNSVRGVFAKLRTLPRGVPHINSDAIHESAKKRAEDPPLNQPSYWPSHPLISNETRSFDIFASEQWNAVGLYLEAGKTYHFKAAGEWLDASIKCSPEGPINDWSLGQVLQKVTLVPEFFQRRRRKKPGQQGTSISGSRREQDLPYFCLVGVIANGFVDPQTQILRPHETFEIGADATHTPTKSGYLYCFANDVWSFYGNNKGSVRLNVTSE
ncbi:DUF2235 domain-containing protein [uncultured Ruegeria sp.]|uniref:DUF2235 domain-containing protein n=1 Tax=uncultured Ruegeria sp. TaxID=259304 RepID=UPI00261511B5|nr:DUF2235 domain-containing protein [uncultured Ruegeria sp.]